jgi:MoaA/NifB/PqqE/SkfB family radical SAM enzyme
MFKNLVELDLTYLLFSLDALNEKTYKAMRGDGYKKAMDTILEIVEYKKSKGLTFPVMRVSFLETDENRHEKQDFIDFWKNKVNFIDVQPCGDYTDVSLRSNVEITSSCQMPFQRMQIGVQGQIGLCCDGYIMRPDFMIGDFYQTTIYEAWNGLRANKLRNAHKNCDYSQFPACEECLTVIQSALDRIDKSATT